MAEHEEYQIHRHAHHPSGAAHLKTFQNKTRAYNEVDRLDNEYGAVAHHVKRVAKEHRDAESARLAGKGSH